MMDEMACGTIRYAAVRIQVSGASPDLYIMSQQLLQICAEVSAAPKFDYSVGQFSQHLEYTPTTAGAFRNT